MRLGVTCVAILAAGWACDDATSPTTGTLPVTVTTTGDAIDGDGFQLLIDDQEVAAVAGRPYPIAPRA